MLLKKQEMCSRFVQGVGFESAESVLPLKNSTGCELIERRVAGTWSYYRLYRFRRLVEKECKELLKKHY